MIIIKLQKKISIFFLILYFGYLIGIFYSFRGIYLSIFDEKYWQDKYQQSQWKLPLSTRTIGDDGLYLSEGYRLVNGGDPTQANAEMPPLGKYLIGLSIKTFNNAYIYGFLTMSLVILVFYFIAISLTKNILVSGFLTILFAFDPLIVNQFPLTMLDSIQLLFLLMTFFFTISPQHFRILQFVPWYIFISGASLGFAAASKFPLVIPIVYLLVCVYLYMTYKRILYLILFTFSAAGFYLLSYSRFFILGNSLVDFLKVQKWMVSFYLNSKSGINTATIWPLLFSNHYLHLDGKTVTSVSQWSFVWPFITLTGFVGYVLAIKNNIAQSKSWILLGLFLIMVILLFTFIPFWPRYLVLVLPFLYLSTGYLLTLIKRPKNIIIFLVFITTQLFYTSNIFFPTPESALRQFTYDWENGFFQDMYEQLAQESQKSIGRWTFHRFGQNVYNQAEIEAASVEISFTNWPRFQSTVIIPVKIIYVTRFLGAFTEDTNLKLIKENGKWKILWSWDNLVNNLDVDTHLISEILPARRGSIIGSDKKPISYDFPSFQIWITPNRITNTSELQMQKLLESIFDGKVAAVSFHNRYVFNKEPDWPVVLGVIPKKLSFEEYNKLISYKSIQLVPQLSRISGISSTHTIGLVSNTQYFECCSLNYSQSSYDGISGIEKDQNHLLKGENGGSLLIVNSQGKVVRTIILKDKNDGNDVIL